MAKLKADRSSSANRILGLLESEKLSPISAEPARTTASEALRLWRTRLKNTKITHKEVDGLSDLVQRLAKVTPNKKVDYFGFNGDGTAVTLLFEKTTGAFIGSIRVRSERTLREDL
jgi:hypothetical protein